MENVFGAEDLVIAVLALARRIFQTIGILPASPEIEITHVGAHAGLLHDRDLFGTGMEFHLAVVCLDVGAIAVAVEEFVALTLTHAKSPLKSFSLRAPTRVSSNHDHGLRANRAEPIHNETVGQLVAGCAHLTRVVGMSALADTFATHQLLVASAVGTNSVRGSLSSSRTQGTDSADAAQTRNASTSLSAGVVLFVGSAFLSADTELVGVVSIIAVAVASLGVVD